MLTIVVLEQVKRKTNVGDNPAHLPVEPLALFGRKRSVHSARDGHVVMHLLAAKGFDYLLAKVAPSNAFDGYLRFLTDEPDCVSLRRFGFRTEGQITPAKASILTAQMPSLLASNTEEI
jgi:hypothetical protein